MLKNAQIRQKVFLLVAGGVLVMAGMPVSHRPEVTAVPPFPKAEDLSAIFRQISAAAIPSVVAIE